MVPKKVTGWTSTTRKVLETLWLTSQGDTGRYIAGHEMPLSYNHKELSGELSSYPASPLIKAGHPVAIINYTRAPKQNLQDMQTQVETKISCQFRN